ncbi:MAG: protease pro-enzyme activation domain-containing protein [Acidimicrobiales bacterium]
MEEAVRSRKTGGVFPAGIRLGLAVLIVAGGCAFALQPAAGADTPYVRPAQFAPKGMAGLRATGAVPGSQKLALSVVLPPSNNVELQALLKNLYNPASPEYHQWLKRGQFDTEFGPSPSNVQAVESWLHAKGLTSTKLSGFDIEVSAPAGTVSSAFDTSFENYRTPTGRVGYAAQDAPLVPQSLATGQISTILGLDTVSRFEPQDRISSRALPVGAEARGSGGVRPFEDGLTPCAAAADVANADDVYTLDQVGAQYGINSLLTQGQNGHGVTIGLYELAAHSPTDVGTYMNCFGLHNSVSTVEVDGGGGSETSNASGEADLDIEQAATQAPGASIISYEGPQNTLQQVVDVWATIVDDDAAQVVSTSWGLCEIAADENGQFAAFDPLFEQAAVQGQSIFAASGDSGSEACFTESASPDTELNVNYPASSSNVTAVGGTSLYDSGEVVWNYCQAEGPDCAYDDEGFGAGGGGLSDFEPRPSYQPSVVGVNGNCDHECREVPDVSANAGVGMVIYVDGQWGIGEGTSFASPLWAAITADKDAGCTTSSGTMTPALYALYEQQGEGTAFHDITSGNNDFTQSNDNQYEASPGYDLATGIGSPAAGGLSCPEVSSVGSGQAGQQVTVSGFGLSHAIFTFGGVAATTVSTSATQATVVVPPGGGTVVVGATNLMGTGVTTSSFTYLNPFITTTSLDPGVVNQPYSQALTEVGGTAPYTWTSSPPLSNGLVLDATTGVIAGTPTSTGTQSLQITVTDAHGDKDIVTLTLSVFSNGSTTVPTVMPSSTTFGTPVTYSATVSSGGGTPTGTVTFTIGSATLCTTGTLSGGGQGSCIVSSAPAGADTVTATYSGTLPSFSFAPSSGTTPLTVVSGPYSPLAPVRICDTRPRNPSNLSGAAAQCNGPKNDGSTLGNSETKTINVANGSSPQASTFGVPADATAVVLNVTATDPTGSGHLTVFPAGASLPVASNLNYAAGSTVPNLVEVGVGTGGDVSINASAGTDVAVDVEGYTSPDASSNAEAGLYNALPTPTRICDTRAGNPSGLSGSAAQCNGPGNSGSTLSAGGTISVQVTGTYGTDVVPAGATAAVLNVTSVASAAAGHLTVYPEGTGLPTASNVNYAAGQSTANRVIVPLSSHGGISVNSSAASDVVVDVSGYFSGLGGTGTQFTAEGAPVRICDTRAGNPSGLTGSAAQCDAKTLGPQSTLTIKVAGLAGVPASGATAVVVNLTGVGPSAQTHLTVFPTAPVPTTSDLNLVPGVTRANLVVATLSSTGTISIYNNAGSTDVVVDVLGWYS